MPCRFRSGSEDRRIRQGLREELCGIQGLVDVVLVAVVGESKGAWVREAWPIAHARAKEDRSSPSDHSAKAERSSNLW